MTLTIEKHETWEKTSGQYTATLRDEAGTAIPEANLTLLTLTLFDVDTEAIVNSRSAQDVLNTNNVTVDANGLLTWSVQPDDVAILTDAKRVERHRAIFHGVASGGVEFYHPVDLMCGNLSMVT